MKKFLVIAALAAWLGCDSPPSDSNTDLVRLTVGPISYFQKNCARCHGSYGRGFLPDTMARYDDAGLQRIVAEMTVGPAQAPLTVHDLTALVAYIDSIRNKKPFIAIVIRDNALEGDVTPKSRLQLIQSEGPTIDVPVDGHRWSLTTNPIVESSRLSATLNGKAVTMGLDQPYSR